MTTKTGSFAWILQPPSAPWILTHRRAMMENPVKVCAACAALLLLASPAIAQEAPRPASEQPPSEPGGTPPGDDAPLTTHLPLEQLMARGDARAAVEKHFPGIEENPLYEHLKSRSLRAIAPMTQGAIPIETLDALDRDLAALSAE